MRDVSKQPYMQWLHADGDEREADKRIEALLRAVAPQEVEGARAALAGLRDRSRLLLSLPDPAPKFRVLRHKLA